MKILLAWLFWYGCFTGMTTVMLPTYLAVHGGSYVYAGTAMSINKFAALAASLGAAMNMRRGLLFVVYVQLCLGIAGGFLVSLGHTISSSKLTILAMGFLGPFNGILLTTMTFIKLNIPVREQAATFLLIEQLGLLSYMIAPLILSWCDTPDSQLYVPFAIVIIAAAATVTEIFRRCAFDDNKFTAALILGHASDARQTATMSRFGIFYVVGTFFPLFANSSFSTLTAIAVQSSYGWAASNLWFLMLPLQIVGIAWLIVLPAMVSRVSILNLLTFAFCMTIAALGVLFPYNNSVTAFRYVIGFLVGAPFVDKLISLVPFTVLGLIVSPTEFPIILARSQVLDGLLGSLMPSVWLYLYSAHELSASFVALLFIAPYSIVTLGYRVLFRCQPRLAAMLQ